MMMENVNMFPILRTERLILRNVQEKDAKDMLIYLSI